MGTKTLVVVVLGSAHWHEISWRLPCCHFLERIWPHSTVYGPQCWNSSGERQPYPSADRLFRVFLGTQLSAKHTLDMAPPTGGLRDSFTQQRSGKSPSHQEACTRQPHSPGDRQQEKELQHCSLQNRIHNHKRQNETAEKYVPDE